MNMLNSDIKRAITALEYYITDFEESLSEARDFGAGNTQWQDLDDYRSTLSNLKLLQAIYGQ